MTDRAVSTPDVLARWDAFEARCQAPRLGTLADLASGITELHGLAQGLAAEVRRLRMAKERLRAIGAAEAAMRSER